ncbi:MAG: cell wall protein, partial [Finegoldia magna]|nr:cell wall protein [Finegoldia magna]
MKLNKKLLTAALAGALIVTAVPAGTFAEKSTVNTNLNKYLTPEAAAKRVNDLSKEINELSARRNAIVA